MVLCDSLVVRDPEQYINENHAITIMYKHNFILSVAHVRFCNLLFQFFKEVHFDCVMVQGRGTVSKSSQSLSQTRMLESRL